MSWTVSVDIEATHPDNSRRAHVVDECFILGDIVSGPKLELKDVMELVSARRYEQHPGPASSSIREPSKYMTSTPA
jgi:hypothetical protein